MEVIVMASAGRKPVMVTVSEAERVQLEDLVADPWV